MRHIKFGPTDLMVSPIGLGCMSMSGYYGRQDDDECIATIHRALDLGVNFLDTSTNYGGGHNQTLIGKAIKGRRDKFVIHSKLGSIRPDGVNVVSGTPEHVRNSCETGLKRLGIDCVDIICISRVDPVVPIEETVGAMARLVEEGKTRHIALSKDASPEIIRRAVKVHPIAGLQDEYSLFVRDPEDGLLEECRQQGMAFMAFAPLGRGILAGLFHSATDIPEDDRRHKDGRYQPGNFERNLSILGQLEEIAAEKGIPVATLALAWLMHRQEFVIPIPSSKSRDHLEENVAAATLELAPEDLSRMAAICPPGAAAGVGFPR
ncbi:MAG: aldo/keto reductase [Proteobacteria bacterium]|nr:aldo/keto reductase [Pseudomonadota bacterium]